MNYYFLFIWLAIISIIASNDNCYHQNEGEEYYLSYIPKRYVTLVSISIIAFAVLAPQRYWGDYNGYLSLYKRIPYNLESMWEVLKSTGNSWLFYVFTYIIKVLSRGSIPAYRLSIAIIQTLPIFALFRRYSEKFFLSAFIFLATGTPFGWMLNGVRQLCAASIIYGATHLIVERKFLKSAIYIAIAILFHQSAIIMIPVIIAAQGKAWNRKTIITIIGTVFLVFVFSRVSGAYESVLQNAGYNMQFYANDDGVHPIRVLLSLVPVVFSYIQRHQINRENNEVGNYMVNMSIMTFCIYFIGMVTSGILVGRIPLYTIMYSYILLPHLINSVQNKNNKRLIQYLLVILYSLYFFLLYGRRL